MKRIIVVFLILMIVSYSGLSEQIDLASLSDLELNELRIRIEEEFAERGNILSTFYTDGLKYVVGDDIPSGDYMVSCVKKTISALTGSKMKCWNSLSDYELSNDAPTLDMFIVLGGSSRVNLKDGNIVEIQGGVLSFNQIK